MAAESPFSAERKVNSSGCEGNVRYRHALRDRKIFCRVGVAVLGSAGVHTEM